MLLHYNSSMTIKILFTIKCFCKAVHLKYVTIFVLSFEHAYKVFFSKLLVIFMPGDFIVKFKHAL